MKSDDDTRISNISPFGLRLLPELKRRVEEAARTNGRSLNAEIAYRLEESLEAEGDARSQAAARSLLQSGIRGDPVKELEKRVEELSHQLSSLRRDFQNLSANADTYHLEMRIRALEGKI
ncbi:Arc family DNA-binding protein [Rhizobium bangladeshense]|uniref:Arc family DNA-binding protein n=1 Tax=Rhizobium bangladeshense TaxID=1138189 RepID=UPI001C83C5B1|nr:Arc family DNA-binding protein [Rhizobium bangladeshense]MBX4884814.1 Arc family DNA-binding protein [Rhizobium bangladeshense]